MSFKLPFSEIAEVVMGQSPTKENVNTEGMGSPLLNGPTEFTTRTPIPVQYTTTGKKFSQPNDILFCVRGSTTGRMNYSDQEYAIGRGIAAIRGKRGYPTPYVRAVIEHNLDRLLVAATGSTFPNVGRDLLSNFEVEVITPEEAVLASNLIEALEDKVESNHQTNQTLEQIAQTLFKSWFVDFDPVKAKIAVLEAGGTAEDAEIAAMEIIAAKSAEQLAELKQSKPETYVQLAQTARLFPSKVCDSELGLIPNNWNAIELSSLINIKHGYAFKGEYFTEKTTPNICITPGNFKIGGGIKLQKFKYYEGPIPEGFVFSSGDLMVTMTDLSKDADTLGYPAFIPQSDEKTFLHNQRIGKIELKVEQDIKSYLYSFFCSRRYRNEVLSGVTGSTVKHTSPKKILAIEVPFNISVVEEYCRLVFPLFEQIAVNISENDMLNGVRESLTPQLLSGEMLR